MSSKPSYRLPLVVAVTGHRNLRSSEVESIRARTKGLFAELRERFPRTRLVVMSPMAEGADLLVAEVAAEESIDLIVPLPKPREAYLEDFRSDEARRKFEALLDKAQDVFEIDGDPPPAPPGVDESVWREDYPYAQLGTYLSAHCHILLAIWDGRPSGHMGGTAQVVQFHREDVMPGVTPVTVATQQMLMDDESDLVYHIVCSRKGGQPHPNYRDGDAYWYTNDAEAPRSETLPDQHVLVFERSAEFSADAERFSERIEESGSSLLTNAAGAVLPDGAHAIDRLFRIADWLAIRYQRRTLATLRMTHLLAFLMGFAFILYSDLESWRYFAAAFLTFFLLAAGAQAVAKHGGWHRKYLDYRTLAEGLRVQFYWAAAGVTHEGKWKFAHDTFLRSQNPEFGWIRNVMRVAGIRSDAKPNPDPSGVRFAAREWVGDPSRGQLGYFRERSLERLKRHSRSEFLGRLSLAVTVVTVLAFLFIGGRLPQTTSAVLTVVMGTSLLLFAVHEGYAYATAVKELLKQYEYMLRIYNSAYRRLSRTDDVSEQRQILSAVGQSALDEHSQWLLMHRDRLFEEGDLLRVGG